MQNPAQLEDDTVSIGQVSKETGLPVSTIRYYAKEFASYLRVVKTGGGHRRFHRDDVEKLKRIHGLVHGEGKSLKAVKSRLVSDRDPVLMRQDIDLLLEVFESLVQENVKMARALEDITARLVTMEDRLKKKRLAFFR
jgi:DNA-binding transcriptional MerR regulator